MMNAVLVTGSSTFKSACGTWRSTLSAIAPGETREAAPRAAKTTVRASKVHIVSPWLIGREAAA
jgi:hypothetical protein